jgi:hypothetical protein
MNIRAVTLNSGVTALSQLLVERNGQMQSRFTWADFIDRRAIEIPMRPRKVRQILWSAFFGALIAMSLMAILIIRSPHAHADPNKADVNAGATCTLIAMDPTNAGIDQAVMNLLSLGYGVEDKGAATELAYALNNVCPQYIPLVKKWSDSHPSQVRKVTVA